MAEPHEIALLEQTRIEQQRLAAALLSGARGSRRTVNNGIKRLIGSVVVAAVACGVCVGISFVGNALQQRAAATPTSSTQPATPTPATSEKP